jgi:lipopolysaccharide export LptBFGC system permease protein LptF
MDLDYSVDTTRICGINMIPYIDYINAKKSLAMAEETIRMMNDPDNYMLEAQRDIRQLEVEYYRETSVKFTIVLLTVAVFCVSLYYLYLKGIINVF